MAEWSIATVLKTAEGHTSGGSNPSLSAAKAAQRLLSLFKGERGVRRVPRRGFVIAERLRSKTPSLSAAKAAQRLLSLFKGVRYYSIFHVVIGKIAYICRHIGI